MPTESSGGDPAPGLPAVLLVVTHSLIAKSPFSQAGTWIRAWAWRRASVAGQGRAVGGWRWALLQQPWGLRWGPGPRAVGGAPGVGRDRQGWRCSRGRDTVWDGLAAGTFLEQRLFSLQEEGNVLVFYHVHTGICKYIKPSP